MTPTLILVTLMLVAMWSVVVSSWRLRGWRATALGLCVSGAIVAAGVFPWPISAVLRAGLWTAALMVFLVRSDLVARMPAVEYRFVEAYVNGLGALRRLKNRAMDMNAATHLAAYDRAVTSLELLDPPVAWADLHTDTVRELRRRVTMITLLVMPSTEALQAGEARWHEIEQRFRQLIRTRAGFWNGWPSWLRLRR